jgi:hypothetical protein
MKQKKKFQIYLPPNVKDDLERMAEETGLSQNQLIVLATQSLLVNYERKGSFIFADLLNPDHKK